MAKWHVRSAGEQVADYLREEIAAGKWPDLMPGADRVASELGIGKDTVDAAFYQLEKEGLLINQGKRKRRKIAAPTTLHLDYGLRLGLLLNDKNDLQLNYVVALTMQLEQAGHQVIRATKTMVEMGEDLKKIGGMVEKMHIHAWLILAGSRDVLQWFANRPQPAFAIFGRRQGLPVASVGPDKISALKESIKTLANLGHKRIVLLTRKRRRWPSLGEFEKAFLSALTENAITATDYHVPDWEESISGFHTRLKALFGISPPTALLLDEAPLFVAARDFLSQKGLKVPQDVSLICNDNDPAFAWCDPQVSHIRWESEPIIRQAVKWAENVGRGVVDIKQILTKSEFIRGGTVAEVKKRPVR